jgi:uncharacterized protein
VHHADFVAAVRWLIEHEDVDGVVNIASPSPLPNAEFMRILRDACGVRFGLPASRWMLEVGAVFMRTETELILKSRRVVPARLLERGFRFRFPTWPEAARDLCRRRGGLEPDGQRPSVERDAAGRAFAGDAQLERTPSGGQRT